MRHIAPVQEEEEGTLTAEDLKSLDSIFAVDKDTGERYPGQHNTFHKN